MIIINTQIMITPQATNILCAKTIRAQCHPQVNNALKNIEVLSSIPSTMDYLATWIMRQPNVNSKHVTAVCLANQQTGGRGQHGRHWASPPGHNIYLSMSWHFTLPPNQLMGLSLATGLAVCHALRQCNISHKLQLKWPNDIMCHNAKLAGILIETYHTTNTHCIVIIGVGLNVLLDSNTKQHIDQPSTALCNLIEPPLLISRNTIATHIINSMVLTNQRFEQEGFNAFAASWQKLDYFYQKPLIVSNPANYSNSKQANQQESCIIGTGAGINPLGAYRIAQQDGTIHTHMSGSIQLQKTFNH